MPYANIKDTAFTGLTGRELRRHPAEVRELQFWLMAGPGRDPFGIFVFEPEMVAPQLGRPAKKIREALEVLIGLGFCKWDETTQYVWVLEMAHHQFLTPLQASDFRCATAQKWYRDSMARNPFMGEWFDRYCEDFHLTKGKHAVERKEWKPRDAPSDAPTHGALMPLNNELFELKDLSGSGDLKNLPPVVEKTASLKGTAVDEQFERLWKAYPKAVEKKACRSKFVTLKPTVALVDEMLEAIAQQQRGESWAKGYIPKLINWLEKGRWLDRVDSQPVVTQRNAATMGAAQRFAERRRGQGDEARVLGDVPTGRPADTHRRNQLGRDETPA